MDPLERIRELLGRITDLSGKELPVEADPSQLEQVLMNLVINAAEAIPPESHGCIGVATWGRDVSPAMARRHAPAFEVRPGRFVCLEVTDNGAGMDESTLSRVFDPFFSTKFTGRGLGLAAVQGIVRSRGGFVEVQSVRGAGSKFRVHLPAAGKEVPAEAPIPAGQAAPRQDRGQGLILVVDDEELVRKLACMTLRRRGYRVLEARDGKEALEVLLSASEMPLLALVDLAMPVMGGDELVPVLNREYPDVKVLITSGYPEEDARKGFAAHSVAGFLQKPYTVMSLTDKINQALAVRAG